VILYLHDGDPAMGPPTLWQGVTPSGYAIVRGVQTSAHLCTAGVAPFTGDAITRIDAGLTLDEAHAALTDGLTKAELVDSENNWKIRNTCHIYTFMPSSCCSCSFTTVRYSNYT